MLPKVLAKLAQKARGKKATKMAKENVHRKVVSKAMTKTKPRAKERRARKAAKELILLCTETPQVVGRSASRGTVPPEGAQEDGAWFMLAALALFPIHILEPTRLKPNPYALFRLEKKKIPQ